MTPLWPPGLNIFMDWHFYLLHIPADLSYGNFTEMIILIQGIHRVPDNNFVKFTTWCLFWKKVLPGTHYKNYLMNHCTPKVLKDTSFLLNWSSDEALTQQVSWKFSSCSLVTMCNGVRKAWFRDWNVNCELDEQTGSGRESSGMWGYHSVLLNGCLHLPFGSWAV